MSSGSKFSTIDREGLERRGITVEDARAQLAMLEKPPPAVELLRACRPGDGITVLEPDRWPALERSWVRAMQDLRVVKFVPASGAATRMFSFLGEAAKTLRDPSRAEVEDAARRGNAAAGRVLELCDQLPKLPFAGALRSLATDRGLDPDSLSERPLALGALIAGSEGLGLASLPKGLIPFHAYGAGTRTSFEEHLFEAAGYAVSGAGSGAVHFTVTPGHLSLFEDAARRARHATRRATGVDFDVTFSIQDPSTDTLALVVTEDGGTSGQPLRSRAGRLVFRPSGHGALIANLGRLTAEVVFIKNIDNVAPARLHGETATWKKRLGGHLLELRERSFELLDRLDDATATQAERARAERNAVEFCRRNLALRLPDRLEHESAEARRRFLIDRLDRPLRVCGVVENVGEPGGGPFWVRDAPGPEGRDAGESGQIVERSQIDPRSAPQVEIFRSAGHFNPVDVVCALDDRLGNRYDLSRFADPDTSFVAGKRHRGQPIRALERPGLWNGAMAGWNTAFVEVPLATFTPVKTILDLARPEHQAASTT